MANMVGGSKDPEALFILADDCVAPRRIHDPVSGEYTCVFREEIANRGEVVIIDREAVTSRNCPDRRFGFEPLDAKHHFPVNHPRTMARGTGQVQNISKEHCG